jgi:hypothetical protein
MIIARRCGECEGQVAGGHIFQIITIPIWRDNCSATIGFPRFRMVQGRGEDIPHGMNLPAEGLDRGK